ncbi:MAG TPA: hypothetical protein VFE31_09680 [Opitutaceae bacterium]|jgi:hypothetical protein|nr:hypothetical protein [Opitutaceae bacterium]
MRNLFIDLYVSAFHFVSRVNPTRGEDGFDIYASNICIVSLFLFAVLLLEIGTAAFGISTSRLFGRSRYIPVICALLMLTVGNWIVGIIVQSIGELRSHAWVRERYGGLSIARKFIVASIPVGSVLGIMAIVALRQYFNAFGGL